MEYPILLLLLTPILVELVLIDMKGWRMMGEQKRHNQAVEGLLSEGQGRTLPKG
jgi:hypothetical protein